MPTNMTPKRCPTPFSRTRTQPLAVVLVLVLESRLNGGAANDIGVGREYEYRFAEYEYEHEKNPKKVSDTFWLLEIRRLRISCGAKVGEQVEDFIDRERVDQPARHWR